VLDVQNDMLRNTSLEEGHQRTSENLEILHHDVDPTQARMDQLTTNVAFWTARVIVVLESAAIGLSILVFGAYLYFAADGKGTASAGTIASRLRASVFGRREGDETPEEIARQQSKVAGTSDGAKGSFGRFKSNLATRHKELDEAKQAAREAREGRGLR
jgi:hypothetical protein